jgi:hypothetical protein
MYAYDPILLEKVEINKWLSESPDNIIILIDYDKNTDMNAFSQFESKKQNIFAINKNYIQNVNIRDIFLKCILINEQLLPYSTYKSKLKFYNLGFYLNRNILINLDEVKPSRLKGQIFNLILSNNKEKYINKEYLLLSNIGIASPIKTKLKDLKNLSVEEKERVKKEDMHNKIIDKKNLPFKKDVYFENLLAIALKDYSFHWDHPINAFLRSDLSYFDTESFILYHTRYGSTLSEAKQSIIDKIGDLDRVFLEAAPRNENLDKIFWRGMKQPFIGLDKIGDKVVVTNFVSISTNESVAKTFSGIHKPSGCCLYKIFLDKGIPYVDMINTTKYIKEGEILLPRRLIFELINIIVHDTPTYNLPYHTSKTMVVHVSMSKTNVKEFQIKTGCREFVLAKLEPIKKTSPFFKIYNKNVETKSNSVEVEVKKKIDNKGSNKTVKKDKLPRCPKGTRRNKKTGLCEPHFKPHAETKFVVH